MTNIFFGVWFTEKHYILMKSILNICALFCGNCFVGIKFFCFLNFVDICNMNDLHQLVHISDVILWEVDGIKCTVLRRLPGSQS